MRLTRLLFIGVAAVALTVIAASCSRSRHRLPEPRDLPQGYSSDITFTDFQNPSKSYRGKLFVNLLAEPRGMREERVYADRVRVSLFSGTKGYLVTLDSKNKTYWRSQTKGEIRAYVESSETGIYGPQEPFGKVNLNGRSALHFRVTEGADAGWEYWVDQKLHQTVKLVKPGISSYELTNIREGRQPASLFEVPADYKEVSRPHSND